MSTQLSDLRFSLCLACSHPSSLTRDAPRSIRQTVKCRPMLRLANPLLPSLIPVKIIMRYSWLAVCGSLLVSAQTESPVRLDTRSRIASRVANIHVDYDLSVENKVSFTYGDCESKREDETHHMISRSSEGAAAGTSQRLVWLIPREADSGGCLSAWDESGRLLGRSGPQNLSQAHTVWKRGEGIEMTPENGINVWGPWFDGVKLLEEKQHGPVDVEAAKAKEIAIIGAGMGGLMTYLVLQQAGLKNITILEGSSRLGGRVRTEYLSGSPWDYSYQEMGPMRIPHTTQLGDKTYNISDQKILFQLAEELNRINADENPDLSVDFIPFYQRSENSFVYHKERKMENGLPPTQADVAEDPSLGPTSIEIPESAQKLNEEVLASLPQEELGIGLAENIWQAHADFLERGGPGGLPGDQWSEFGYLVNFLNATVTDANAITGGIGYHNYLGKTYYAVLFGPYTNMKTVDGGMNRLPNAFAPLVDDIISFDSKVERIKYHNETSRLTLQWRGNYTEKLESGDYDYAIVTAPLPVVQRMRLPDLPFAIRNAIDTMTYGSACKVALEYKSRFWEHFDKPIYGSCDTSTDIPGLGSICYPSHGINSTGPGSILATYEIGPPLGVQWVAVAEEQHVQYVVDAMAEIHGDIALEEYTGKHARHCWQMDEFAAGGWAAPLVGDHETYLPAFFKTHSNVSLGILMIMG